MPKVLTPDEILMFRNRMCDLALEAFAKHGVEGISLRGLAADLSCSRTTPYRYFKNKADILAAVRQREYARIADILEDSLVKQSDTNKQLLALMQAYIQFAVQNPDSYRVMYNVSQPDSAQYTELEAEILRSAEPMRQVVHTLVETNNLYGEPSNIFHILWAGLHGLISLHLADLIGNTQNFEELAKVMIDALIRSVSTATKQTA